MSDSGTRPAGILLAAGFGRRFDASGQRSKLLAAMPDGRPVAWHSASALARALPDALAELVAVIRPGNPALASQLRDAGCRVVEAPQAEAGMGAALAAAVAASADARGWVVALADMPWLTTETIRAVANAVAHAAANDQPDTIAAPWRDGRRGHPVGFGPAWRAALMALDGDEGARALLKTQPVTRIGTHDDGAFRDVDSPADLS